MTVSPDAQAILLLTAHFTRSETAVRPLSPGEWGRLATWLRARSRTPAALLTDDLDAVFDGWTDDKITRSRIEALLQRGAALALALERWSRAGLWVTTRADADYPVRLKRRLREIAPPVLFGCGDTGILEGRALAVVGSRQAPETDLTFARRLGERAAREGCAIVSGGAKGVDEVAMTGALEAGGRAVGVLSAGLLRACTSRKYRDHLTAGRLLLLSPFHPEAGFRVANAMQRNKYVYCLADAAVVVHSGTKGGTWNGARENLHRGWVPLWVKRTDDADAGNAALAAAGGRWLPEEPDGKLSVLFSVVPEPVNEGDPDPRELEFYDLFLVKIRDLCQDAPRSRAELAETLKLQKSQLDVWLRQAEREGKLEKLTRPVRYRWRRPRQESLFEPSDSPS